MRNDKIFLAGWKAEKWNKKINRVQHLQVKKWLHRHLYNCLEPMGQTELSFGHLCQNKHSGWLKRPCEGGALLRLLVPALLSELGPGDSQAVTWLWSWSQWTLSLLANNQQLIYWLKLIKAAGFFWDSHWASVLSRTHFLFGHLLCSLWLNKNSSNKW